LTIGDDELAALIDAARPLVDAAVELDDFPCIFRVGRQSDDVYRLATGNPEGGVLVVIRRGADGRFKADEDVIPWSRSPW
jgi:hypothetical protein